MREQSISTPQQTSFDTQQFIQQKIVQPTGVIRKKRFQKLRFISQHASGKYYIIKDSNQNKYYRAKIIFKSQLKSKDKARLLIEIENQQRISHPNFVKLEKIFENDHCVYLLAEMHENGSLEELMVRKKRLSQQEVAFYFRNLIDILVELTRNKVMHRDIRVESIQVGNDLTLKLGDFGSSCMYEGERKKSILKLNHYSSPEIINQTGHGFQTDLWSVGVIVYMMLVGTEPFRSGDTFSITKIQKANVFFPNDIAISPFWKNTLKRIFIQKIEDRITLQQLQSLEIPEVSSSLPPALLNVTNRFPSYFQKQKKEPNSTFLSLHQHNFKLPPNESKNKSDTVKLVKSDLLKSIALQISMTQSRVIKKTNFTVVDDWILSNDTISYQIGCFICVNFVDRTRMYSSHCGIHYQNAEGTSTVMNEESSMESKNTHRKYRFYQSMVGAFETGVQELDAPCPFFIERVCVEEKFVLFLLSNGGYQVSFVEEPGSCYLMASKGRIQHYTKGKQSDTGSRFAEVEKIINVSRKKLKQ